MNVPSNLFKWFFPGSWVVSHVLNSRLAGSPLKVSRAWAFFLQLFSLRHSAVWPLATGTSPDSHLHLSHSGRLLYSTWISSPYNMYRLWAGTTVGHTLFVSHLSGITILKCLIYRTLKTIISYNFPVCFRWKGMSGCLHLLKPL